MELTEFISKYNLHDSLLEKIEFDSTSRKLNLEVDFCYWAQPSYKEGTKENGTIKICFTEVNNFVSEVSEPESDSILEVDCINENQLKITVETDDGDVLSICFEFESVDVVE